MRGLNEATALARVGSYLHKICGYSSFVKTRVGGLFPLWSTKTLRPRSLGSFKRLMMPTKMPWLSFFPFPPTRIFHHKSILSSVDRAIRSLTTDVSAVKPFAH